MATLAPTIVFFKATSCLDCFYSQVHLSFKYRENMEFQAKLKVLVTEQPFITIFVTG